MKVAPVVLRLRQIATSFDGQVYGAAEMVAADKELQQVPAAFVVELDQRAKEMVGDYAWNGQTLTEYFAVVVALNNSTDVLGHTAHEQLFDIRAEIWKSILGWKPTEEQIGLKIETPISYVGAKIAFPTNRARLWWEFIFKFEFVIDTDDGVDPETFDMFDRLWTQWIVNPSSVEMDKVKLAVEADEALPVVSNIIDRKIAEDEIDYTS